MSKGGIITKAILARLSLTAVVLLLCAPVTHAQQGNPEIYVDMGALQGVGDAPATSTPIKLKPPVPKPAHEQGMPPRLTAPMAAPPEQKPAQASEVVTRKPLVTPPAAKKRTEAAALPPPVPKPKPVPSQTIPPETVSKAPEMPPDVIPLKSAPPPPDMNVQPITPPAPAPVVTEALPVAPEAAQTATVFPVETRVREETNDPTVSDSSRPVPLRPGIAGNLRDTVVPARPLPDMDPAAVPPPTPVTPVRDLTERDNESVAAAPEVKKTAPAKVPPMVPGRRPNFVDKAPAELVATLRAREAARADDTAAQADLPRASTGKGKIDLSNPPPPPGPRGQKNMPAVKKAAVDAEAVGEQVVKLPVQHDPLLDSLVEKDKQSLVTTIESMVAAREDGKPLPAPAKPKRDVGTNIVKAEPMQRPYSVYRPEKKTGDETEMASLPAPAAASNGPRPPQPQAHDEQAYVSVPFAGGLTEIDGKITAEIETRILPILNQNPGWKLQIQAFASPVKDGASSARKASLARALSVRTYLLGKGIDATRMDVRALGAESDRDPMDRVDLIIFDPAKRG